MSDNNTYLYTGHPIHPKFTLNIGGKELQSGSDYDVEISDNINAGTAHVIIRGKGKFKGEIERTFEIKPVPAASLSFLTDQTEFDYTGEPCTMQIVVRYGDITLTEGEDYTVAYIDNIEPGTAGAVLSFSGNYQGVITIPFSIFRPQQPSAPAADDVPPLENVSFLSAETVPLGASVHVTVKAQGGAAPYTYGVYFRKMKAKNWTTVQDYGDNTQADITPARATRYLFLVKVKDSRGVIAKQYFKVSVTDGGNTDGEEQA